MSTPRWISWQARLLPWPVVVGALALALLLLLAPDALAASGNDVGQNVGNLLQRSATEIYGGIVAIVGLIFLINRRYTELGMFLLAAVVVAWLVFSPDQVAAAARAIGGRVLG